MLHTLLSVAFGLVCVILAPIAEAAATCAGDCDGDLEIDTMEFSAAVEIALGRRLLESCPAAAAAGRVDVAQLVTVARNRIEGCPGAPTRTRTPSPSPTRTATPSGTPTPTVATSPSPSATSGPVIPGCDNGTWTFTYADAVGTNAVTTEVEVGGVGATEVHDSRGFYTWLLSGVECVDGVVFHRGVSLQMILQTSAIVPGTYALNPPFANLLYQEIQEPLVFIRSWSNNSGGSLTVDEADGTGFRFHLSAPMKPSTIVSLNSVPEGTFTLKISGTVKKIVRP